MYHKLRYFALHSTSTHLRVIKLFLRQALPLCIAISLLGYALKDVSVPDLLQQFRQASYGWILLAALTSILLYLVRGKRWQQALMALGYKPSAFRAAIALQSGTIASMLVFGSGEITRCATLQRTDNIPFSQSIGSVIAERVIDILVLGLLLLLTFLLQIDRMRAYFSAIPLMNLGSRGLYLFGISAVILIVVGLCVWTLLSNPVVRKHPIVYRILHFGTGMWQGFSAVRQLPNPLFFIFLTLFYQVIAWLNIYLLLRALEATHDLSPSVSLTILAVSSLGGLAVPTQGGIGTYHFLVSRALVLYGFTAVEGAVIATFLHAVGFGINLLLSGISFLVLPTLIAKKEGRDSAWRPSSKP